MNTAPRYAQNKVNLNLKHIALYNVGYYFRIQTNGRESVNGPVRTVTRC